MAFLPHSGEKKITKMRLIAVLWTGVLQGDISMNQIIATFTYVSRI
jgi:hypothetical protein